MFVISFILYISISARLFTIFLTCTFRLRATCAHVSYGICLILFNVRTKPIQPLIRYTLGLTLAPKYLPAQIENLSPKNWVLYVQKKQFPISLQKLSSIASSASSKFYYFLRLYMFGLNPYALSHYYYLALSLFACSYKPAPPHDLSLLLLSYKAMVIARCVLGNCKHLIPCISKAVLLQLGRQRVYYRHSNQKRSNYLNINSNELHSKNTGAGKRVYVDMWSSAGLRMCVFFLDSYRRLCTSFLLHYGTL